MNVPRTNGRFRARRRTGYTFIELIVSLSTASIIVGGLSSSLYIASHALNQDGTARRADADQILDKFVADVEHALSFSERTANAVTFTVPDRDGDIEPDTIRYAWSGALGDPLTYEYNGSAAEAIAKDVHNFNLTALTRLMIAPVIPAAEGGNKLLFVAGNSTSLTTEETAFKSLVESWGYTVELIDDNDSQAAFDAAVANNDVVLITNDITASNLSTKLVAATIGVVTSECNLSDEFGLASSIGWESGNVVVINDDTHYITLPFAPGNLAILSGFQSLAYVSGTLSPELGELASSASGYGIVTLDSGAAMYGGGNAAGRRGQLPWGGGSFNPNNLTTDGETILQRALEWAAGAVDDSGPNIVLSTDSDATLGGLSFEDIDLARYKDFDGTASLLFDGSLTTLNKDIDAVHLLANGHILLSVKDSSTLGGISLDDGDLADYDPVTDTATLVFDGSTLFTDPDEKIKSVHLLDNGHLVLSTDSNATLGGLSFTDKDLAEYALATDTATLYADSSTTTLDGKIDAVHILENGHIILSVKDSATSGGISCEDGDLIDYDPVADSATLYFDGSGLFTDPNEKIRSAHVGPGSGSTASTALVAHWKLDESSGSTASDSSGSGHDGTLTGGPTWTTGTIDGGLLFDGVDDEITAIGYKGISGASPRTVTAWIKTTAGIAIVYWGGPGSGTRWNFRVEDAGRLRVSVNSGWIIGTTDLRDGAWHHVASVLPDGLSDATDVLLYVDGALELVSSSDPQSINTASTDDLTIGNNVYDNWFTGTMDDVRLYDRALTPAEIATLAAAGGGGGPTILDVTVATGNDDAEESVSSGSVNRTSSDLEMVSDGSTNQLVGMRFTGVSVPPGATISSAYIQFQVDETNSGATSVSIEIEASDDAATFTTSTNNISNRPTAPSSVPWSPPAWSTVGDRGPDQQTPDIAALIQAVVDRPGWSSGNAMTVIITGTGERTAESYNGSASGAAMLHIEY